MKTKTILTRETNDLMLDSRILFKHTVCIFSILMLPLMTGDLWAQIPISLDEAINAGLANSPELRVKKADLDLVRSQQIESWLPFPSPLTVNYENSTNGPFGGQGENTREFGLSQQIEWPGSFLLRRKVNGLNVKSAEEEVKQAQINTIATTQEAFYRLFIEQSRKTVFDSIVAFNNQLAELAQKRFKAGIISKLDYNLALIERDQAHVERNDAENRHNHAMIQLSRLIGRNPDELIIAQKLTATVSTLREDELVQRALYQRHDYLSVQYSAIAKQQRASQTWMSFIPNPIFKFNWSRHRSFIAGEDFLGQPEIVNGIKGISDNERFFTFGVSFEFPILNLNLAQATIQQIKAKNTMAEAETEMMRLKVITEVKIATKRFQLAQTSWQAYQEILPRTQQNIALLLQAYDVGEIDIVTLLIRHDRLL